jgi:hypothetical protein
MAGRAAERNGSHGPESPGGAAKGTAGLARQRWERQAEARQEWRGKDRTGTEWHGSKGSVRRGAVRLVAALHGRNG